MALEGTDVFAHVPDAPAGEAIVVVLAGVEEASLTNFAGRSRCFFRGLLRNQFEGIFSSVRRLPIPKRRKVQA